MLDIDTILSWRGKTVQDRDGEKAGTLGAIYLDEETDLPAYAGVHTGLFRRNESIVPLHDAREADGDVRLPYTLEQIKTAPHVDPDHALDEEQQSRLHEHYGEPSRIAAGDDGPAAEMVRSEEEVDVHAGPARPRERIRLKKYWVTERVKKTVPVQRERVAVERVPPEEDEAG
jgi:hypothetical protein